MASIASSAAAAATARETGTALRQATGIYFICLAANLSRQFEFVQHTWLNNPTFNGLYDDTDPLTGSPPRWRRNLHRTGLARPAAATADLPQFVRDPGRRSTSSCPASPPCAISRSCRDPSHPDPERVIAWPRASPLLTTTGPRFGSSTTVSPSSSDRKVGWDRLPVPLGARGDPGDPRRAEGPEPLRHQRRAYREPAAGGAPTPQVRTHPDARRHLQRPERSPDGDGRVTVRPERADRGHLTRIPAAGHHAAQPPRGEPRPADQGRADPGDGGERAGRDVAAVHDPATGSATGRARPDDPVEIPLADDDPWPGLADAGSCGPGPIPPPRPAATAY